MAGTFSSVWRKIERAKKHTDDLEAEIIAFWATKPYEIETQGNPKTGPGSYRIKGTPQPLPDIIPLIVGDAAHTLRSALDHFACAAVTPVTGNTAFPVWRATPTPTKAAWRGEVKGKLKGASHDLMRAVERLQAYQTGNGQHIWAINELDRIDKHRLLIAVAGANTAVILDFSEIAARLMPESASSLPSIPLAVKPQWTPVEDGTELFTVESATGFYSEPKFTFEVALGEPEVLKGEPVVPALRRLIDEVEGLLKRLIPLA